METECKTPRKFGRCRECKDPANGRDRLCAPCRGFRAAKNNFAKRQGPVYPWNDRTDLLLKRAYATRNRKELSRNLMHLSAALKYPKGALRRRAEQLGLTIWSHVRWTPQELEFLEEHAGSKTIGWICRELKKRTGVGRSYNSIVCKAEAIGRHTRLREGYTQADLAELFGIDERTVSKWFAQGWIEKEETGRVSDAQVLAFIRAHPHEWYFKRIDEAWLKGLLFPIFNSRRPAHTAQH